MSSASHAPAAPASYGASHGAMSSGGYGMSSGSHAPAAAASSYSQGAAMAGGHQSGGYGR